MNPVYPIIRLRGRGEWLAGRDGVVLAFFIHRDHSEVGPAVWRSIQAYRHAIPPGSLNWYTSADGDMVPLDDEGWEHNRHVVIERIGGGSRTVELRESPSETGNYQVEYYGRRLDSPIHDAPATTLSFTFPTEYLLEHGAVQLRALAMELARELPFNFGYASFAIVSSRGSWAAADWNQVESLLARYPGLDIPHAGEFSSRLGDRALSASWLTFLGQPLLGALGGIHVLKDALSFPDVSLLPMDGERLLVTLNEWPDPIDTEKAAVPAQYGALAHLLEPFTFQYSGKDLIPYESDMNKWLRRLLQ
ncbi:type VI immunity family protein [Corallococcus carmarthensis]|uniref:DUF3396 domain-containing protein n=1 Tax=Corallococcus carmarthensis TaxID=2316728 RepID=A0A3A8JRV5_9BACT|nr:type VI immunity family protein [Corallococcus carmarthensis]NOK20331.1 DUF3396 domain-containing protein [Corallococcus carmarthensis]RKG97698.1 DUF3396 domain-containing protein [Corallococcus carmarthensis]